MFSSPRLMAIARWLKANPIVTIIGVVGTIFGVVKGAPPAWRAAMEMLGLPDCLTYSSVYHYPDGVFRVGDGGWIENNDDGNVYRFKESYRNRNYIVLLNTTPRQGRRSSMILRIPVCGGTAQWTYENPQLVDRFI
jgi:hypothetical protein